MSRLTAIISCLTALALVPNIASSQPEGAVRFYNIADSDFDIYSGEPDDATQRWMREHYVRMQTYSPYFDRRLAWFPNAWVYKDSYAIKPDWPEYRDHPEWILKDKDGNELYIPWGCENGSCPQFAADVGNPEFRRHWISEAAELIDAGYSGIWVDDVNLAWRVGDGNGRHVTPIDPRTDAAMTLDDWRDNFATFMEEIRAAFPDIEIAHNSIWYAGPFDNETILRQIDAADYINLERGATDPGLEGGRGRFSLFRFFRFVDLIHERGKYVTLMDYGETLNKREYALAAWLLISTGKDMLSSNQLAWTAPDRFWPGFKLDLGNALGNRRGWRGLLRRDFECGIALLNEPGNRHVSVPITQAYLSIDSKRIDELVLGPGSAAVLVSDRPECRISG